MLVFDARYQVVAEETTSFTEEVDDDGYPCENLDMLIAWVLQQVELLKQSKMFQLKAINFSTYGASLLYIDAEGKRIAPLYNYLKPYPPDLLNQFYAAHGEKEKISQDTSSPIMGHLNAGLQLYWLKYQRPGLYEQLAHVLHFPQYLGFRLTGEVFAENTNVGCHSAMWNFKEMAYHSWLQEEGILPKLSGVIKGNQAVNIKTGDGTGEIAVGVGLHDSSAAIIPYLLSFRDPFVIISTGTWTISLNPFNKNLPQVDELNKGCLSYLTYEGDPVKISMLFAGHDHDQQVEKIAQHFNVQAGHFKSMHYDGQWIHFINNNREEAGILEENIHLNSPTEPCVFHLRPLSEFQSAEHAYHQLLVDIINRQAVATQMVINNSDVKNMYVDGGFCRNNIYMQLLTDAFSGMNVYATSMIQGSALGAALAIHHEWNAEPLPGTLITLKHWPKSADQSV